MNPSEFARRRKTLMRMIGEDAIAIVPSAESHIRNRDVEYPFRQDSDFLYLTGFEEPQAVAVLVPGRPHGEYLMFCRESDKEQETWHGRRAGVEGVLENLGADDAFPVTDADEIVPGLIEGRERVFYTMGRYTNFDARVMDWVNSVRRMSRGASHAPNEFVSLEYYLHDMRLYKSRAELSLMRRAARTSARAHKRAMRTARPGQMEFQVAAELHYEFECDGCTPAYPSIVGGGENSCILHYTENSQELRDGDLLLIDAGAECQGYAADVTRTFPVNGEFSPVQRDVYEIVLAAQQAAIDKVVPGNHWNDPHEAAVKVLSRGLVELGLLKGRTPKLIREGAYRQFYMHRTGHWLGMDVHDVGDYKIHDEWRLLEAGMALTVEPGLYITPARGVPKALRNIGIRIEDDVVVTRDGCEVLSRDAPKDPDEIEKLMAA
ncbi:MAG: Xaa-Pro aminopeptidase [Gammaproteobacteria bacterium]|nr:Xaa-Pro aminopeptidase [Gammaproteobacteria bacterium]